jgi:predicted nucleic acid-binding protein
MAVEFIDTNILVYAHSRAAGARYAAAADLVVRLASARSGALSTQILSEFFSVATGKLRMPSHAAEEIVRDFSFWNVHRPSPEDLLNAIRLQRRHRLAWWDALVVNSALALGASVLWTEDLNHGQKFGNMIVQNPFL